MYFYKTITFGSVVLETSAFKVKGHIHMPPKYSYLAFTLAHVLPNISIGSFYSFCGDGQTR